MKTTVKFFYYILFALFLISCDWNPYNHYSIKIKNNSNSVVYSIYKPVLYPHSKEQIKVESKQINDLFCGDQLGWEEYIRKISSDTLVIYFSYSEFIDNDTVNNNYEQEYDLTLEDLNSLKWTVSYPPDEKMKNMKMYPPYKE
jgi:hypothetical protein